MTADHIDLLKQFFESALFVLMWRDLVKRIEALEGVIMNGGKRK